VDPSTVPHVDDDPDWVNAPIPVSTPVFQTSPPVTDRNPVNNQLADGWPGIMSPDEFQCLVLSQMSC